MAEKEKRHKARQEPTFRVSKSTPEQQEAKRRLKIIEQTIRDFPKIVKQNAARGKAHRKLMKAFEPLSLWPET